MKYKQQQQEEEKEEEEEEESKQRKKRKQNLKVNVLNFHVSMSRACHALILFGKSPKERHLVQKDQICTEAENPRAAQEDSRLSFSL